MTRRVLLMDNGSLEPAGTLQLRRLAMALEAKLGMCVEPVSVAHSVKVAAEELEGRPAELFEAALERVIAEGAREIVVAPLFVGPSHAVVRHVPAVVAGRTKLTAGLSVKIASPLFVPGEKRLAEILADHVRQSRGVKGNERVRVAVVDHGSPSRAVTTVRDEVAAQLRGLLKKEVAEVAACSMERRAGEEFAFNEPLLEGLLGGAGWCDEPLIIALLFIAPGRHAGPDGDVAGIVRRSRGGKMDTVRFTPVLGAHPRLVEILTDRVAAAVAVA